MLKLMLIGYFVLIFHPESAIIDAAILRQTVETVTRKFQSMKDVYASVKSSISTLDSAEEIKFTNQTMNQTDFHRLNDNFRSFIKLENNSQAASKMDELNNWIDNNYSPSTDGLIIQDVRVSIKKSTSLLSQISAQIREINTRRSNALSLPFSQKIQTVNEALNDFIDLRNTYRRVIELLDQASHDLEVFFAQETFGSGIQEEYSRRNYELNNYRYG